MSGTLIATTIENNKKIALVKEDQCHRLLTDLAALVKEGDRLAIEGYLRLSGSKGVLIWQASNGSGENGGSGHRLIYAEMVKKAAVNHVLVQAGRPMTSVEIYEALVRGGYPFTGRDPVTVFRSEVYKLAAKAPEKGKFVPLPQYMDRTGLVEGANGSGSYIDGDMDAGAMDEALAFFGLGSVGQLERTSPEFSGDSAMDGDNVSELVLGFEGGLADGVVMDDLSGLGALNRFGTDQRDGVVEVGRGALDAANIGDFSFLDATGALVDPLDGNLENRDGGAEEGANRHEAPNTHVDADAVKAAEELTAGSGE